MTCLSFMLKAINIVSVNNDITIMCDKECTVMGAVVYFFLFVASSSLPKFIISVHDKDTRKYKMSFF